MPTFFFITHYTLRGRDSYGRQFCGCWIVSFNSDYSYNVWLIGAALSRVHIMLNVAVFLEIKFSVVLLMFLLLIFILMLSGVLVLLYYYTHYTIRGGVPHGDAFWGIFFVSVDNTASAASWRHGAALDCKVL